MFDAAGPNGDFDKVVSLQFGETYTGGLELDGTYCDEVNLKIIGNGAILDMQGERLYFSNMDKELDISDLIITNGYISFNGLEIEPRGSVKNVTFYQPKNYAVLMALCGNEIIIERNIVVEAQPIDFFGQANPTGISFGLDKDYTYETIIDNWSYNSPNGNFIRMCNTGWGFTPIEWSEASLAPNNNIIGIDPLVNPSNNYQLESNSPAQGYGVITNQANNTNYSELPITTYKLKQNYPNPFNPYTQINYELRITNYEFAEIVVHNSIGEQVWFSPINDHGSKISGSIHFDGSNFNSGIYYYSLIVDRKWLSTKSMILIK